VAIKDGRIAAVGIDLGGARRHVDAEGPRSHPASSTCTPITTRSCCGIRSPRPRSRWA
jgi:hypothetical protein